MSRMELKWEDRKGKKGNGESRMGATERRG